MDSFSSNWGLLFNCSNQFTFLGPPCEISGGTKNHSITLCGLLIGIPEIHYWCSKKKMWVFNCPAFYILLVYWTNSKSNCGLECLFWSSTLHFCSLLPSVDFDFLRGIWSAILSIFKTIFQLLVFIWFMWHFLWYFR